jgi:hypothetical protein
MLKKSLSAFVLSIGVLSVIVSACGGDAPPPRAQDPPAPPRATVPPKPVMPVEIVSVSPETIDIRGGRAMPTTFTIEYRIANPEKVEKAEIRIVAKGLGIIKRDAVPVQASGIVTLSFDSSHDFGPLVRFRVTCPQGTTDWQTLGAPPLPLEERQTGEFRITAVSPSHVEPDYSGASVGSGVRIGVHGRGFSKDCTVEAERDGSTIHVNNPYFSNRSMHGLLMHRDIDSRPVAGRFLEFGLSIHGPGVGRIHHKHVLFNE